MSHVQLFLPFLSQSPTLDHTISPKNLISSGHGIIIQSSNVTVDLNGYSITGSDTSFGGSSKGIYVAGTPGSGISNIRVHDGTIAGFLNSVSFTSVHSSQIQSLRCSQSGNDSLTIEGNNITVSQCSVYNAGNNGIVIQAFAGESHSNSIANCTIQGTNSHGILLDTRRGKSHGNTIRQCLIYKASSIGIYLNSSDSGACDGNTITHNTIRESGSYGIRLNGNGGTNKGNALLHNTISNSQTNGVWLNDTQNNRIEQNHVTDTKPRNSDNKSWGIETSGTSSSGNIIVRNTCLGQTNNFDLNSNDTAGPIVTSSGTLSTTGAAAHPWANFSR